MVEHSNGVYIGSKIPQILKIAIENTLSTGNYLNTSDFIRHAVKEKLYVKVLSALKMILES